MAKTIINKPQIKRYMNLAPHKILTTIGETPIYVCRGRVVPGTGHQREADQFLAGPEAYMRGKGFTQITKLGDMQLFERALGVGPDGLRANLATVVWHRSEPQTMDVRGNQRAVDLAKMSLGLPIYEN
jgi:hypothetical protein